VAEIDAAYAELFESHLGDIRPNPEAPALLAALRERGIRTAVATNTHHALAWRILGRFDLLGSFDALAAADEAGAGKPDPAVLHLASKLLDVPLGSCLFVGDSRYDEEASRRAAVPFLGYRYGEDRIESLDELLEKAVLAGKG
jgi:HAD superfamily hydrolase (TIGR01509 family)